MHFIYILILRLILAIVIFDILYRICRIYQRKYYKAPFSDTEMKKFCKEQDLPEWKGTVVTEKEIKEKEKGL